MTAAFLTQTLTVDDRTVKFEIWDTAGQERYHSLAPMYYRGAQAAIVVYDITSQVYIMPLYYRRDMLAAIVVCDITSQVIYRNPGLIVFIKDLQWNVM